jgi:polyisoprenoid-binding protein YceI
MIARTAEVGKCRTAMSVRRRAKFGFRPTDAGPGLPEIVAHAAPTDAARRSNLSGMGLMPNTAKRALVALLILAPALAAFRAASNTLTLQPESRLWVDGTSNVRSFSCAATSLDVQVAASDDAVSRVLAGEKAVTGVDVTVRADSLDCKNGKMNGHMRKALKAEEHPDIRFHLATYDLVKDSLGVAVTLSGTLTLGGTEKPITVAATARPDSGGALRVAGTYVLKMKDYGLKPPSLMLGAFKVNNEVTVNFDLHLKGAQAATE